jgi:hypothetical protein
MDSMATGQSTQRRRDLALTEIDALALNLINDVRAMERKLIALSPGLAVAVYADARILETGAECIRHELIEARADTAPAVVQSPGERAAAMSQASAAAFTRAPCPHAPRTSTRPAA